MDPLTIGIVAGGNLLASAFAARQGAKANRQIRRDTQEQIDTLEGLFNQEAYGSPFSRPDTQAALTKTREGLKSAMHTNRSNAVRTGATAEKEVAGQEGASRGYADTMTGILSADVNRRDMAKHRYQNMISRLKGEKARFDMNDSQKWGQLMQNVGNLSGTAIDVLNSGTGTGTTPIPGQQSKLPPIDPTKTNASRSNSPLFT